MTHTKKFESHVNSLYFTDKFVGTLFELCSRRAWWVQSIFAKPAWILVEHRTLYTVGSAKGKNSLFFLERVINHLTDLNKFCMLFAKYGSNTKLVTLKLSKDSTKSTNFNICKRAFADDGPSRLKSLWLHFMYLDIKMSLKVLRNICKDFL